MASPQLFNQILKFMSIQVRLGSGPTKLASSTNHSWVPGWVVPLCSLVCAGELEE